MLMIPKKKKKPMGHMLKNRVLENLLGEISQSLNLRILMWCQPKLLRYLS